MKFESRLSAFCCSLLLTALSGCSILSTQQIEQSDPANFSVRNRLQATEQLESYSCGSAALSSVVNYWSSPDGKQLTEEEILSNFPPRDTDAGYSLGELKAIAKSQGFRAFSFQSDLKFLKGQLEKKRPIIVVLRLKQKIPVFKFLHYLPITGSLAEWLLDDYEHMVVVVGLDEKGVQVMDPADGEFVAFRIEEFNQSWEALGNPILLVSR
ncbi:cysteine peptidase family C39 domain-containing protein [Marinobacter sp. CHS3-4]|uniref:cysteine peptidase family C39 domain-containing protein n=1 Tax=Marinobacter sp. CHS3-4 TaxID=3045174 RepID=UPI0024B5F2CD|nr:cysteine peptidase family C39 domain-containing protein [Marinobacter sp. CHS3-4]MDI9245378.1 cysteine peptidase family C39 domain-containing protein [Marinobacter sp. CHS3-4]